MMAQLTFFCDTMFYCGILIASIANAAQLRCRMSILTGPFQREEVVLNIRSCNNNL